MYLTRQLRWPVLLSMTDALQCNKRTVTAFYDLMFNQIFGLVHVPPQGSSMVQKSLYIG